MCGSYDNSDRNGFAYAVVNAPIIISDGIYSKDSIDVHIYKKHFDTVKILQIFTRRISMVVMSHFKGHETGRIGGAIKNLAMGAHRQRGNNSSIPFKACSGQGL